MLRRIGIGVCLLTTSILVSSAMADPTEVTITVGTKLPGTDVSKAPFRGKRPAVDVAILLDTSNSMDGLINQAKAQLWTIVQQFAKAKKNGKTPELRVALFEYGNTRLPAAEGYLRQVVPLTDDLDKLSEALFSLTTSGGDEYCGQVIDEAVTRLDWSNARNSYKTIFIAGNEPFTQGSVDYRAACKRAIEKGIVVNTIHCGNQSEGVNGQWQNGAQLAEGEFFNIDQDKAVVQIKCPQDEIIIKLSADLNDTYLWYGAKNDRLSWSDNQTRQDNNASRLSGGVAASRAAAKACPDAYCNRGRDLVDTIKEDKEILIKLKVNELPEEMQKMTAEERVKCVNEKGAKRAEIQKKIAELTAEREKYIAEQRKLDAKAAGDTLGDAVVSTVRKQLAKSGFDSEEAAK